MKKLQDYLKRKLIKRQRPNFRQIKQQLERAERDLKIFDTMMEEDTGWASAIAYQSMLRAGRALMFAHGFLPIDGQQHKTYCIFNRQYTKEEYSKTRIEIIAHMRNPAPQGGGQASEWGEFFPMEISPYKYEETLAMDYYPK